MTLEARLAWTFNHVLILVCLPAAEATADIVHAIAHAVDDVSGNLAGACDVALDLLAQPVVAHCFDLYESFCGSF